MNDVAPVRDELKQRYGMPEYSNDLRGAGSLVGLWHYYYPTWTPAQAACEQLRWADSVYPAEYGGFTVFTWSSSNGWASFDMSGYRAGWFFELHQMLEKGEC
jgi:hypothetical protein